MFQILLIKESINYKWAVYKYQRNCGDNIHGNHSIQFRDMEDKLEMK